MPLLNYTPLADPVLISKVRASETELRQALADLETQYPDGRLYFPFGFSDKRELRAQQTYFVKMPQEVIEVLGLGDLERAAGPRLPPPPGSTGRPTGKADKRVGSGYMADSAVRSAIEWRAVNLAIEAYESDGYSVDYTGASNPYDLVVEQGEDKRRVEVKGSSGTATTVELTYGEVDNSREATPTDLYVVDGIQWWREADGSVQADGGDVRSWRDWTAQHSSLKAIRFRYILPSGGKHPTRAVEEPVALVWDDCPSSSDTSMSSTCDEVSQLGESRQVNSLSLWARLRYADDGEDHPSVKGNLGSGRWRLRADLPPTVNQGQAALSRGVLRV